MAGALADNCSVLDVCKFIRKNLLSVPGFCSELTYISCYGKGYYAISAIIAHVEAGIITVTMEGFPEKGC